MPESGTGPAQSSGSAAGGEEDELEASYHSGAGVQVKFESSFVVFFVAQLAGEPFRVDGWVLLGRVSVA